MNASPVGIASAWSTIRADAVRHALEVAVARQEAKAADATLEMVQDAEQPAKSLAREGQGERVDIRA